MIQDKWITTPSGRLFARSWTPPDAKPGAAPIVLLHDSLGCVELWRDFPARLARTSGRTVIAYDRLGFGKSAPYPGTLPRGFIGEEARGGFAALREQLGLERFVAFGHSVGGGMAVECAAAYPAGCDAVVTESAQAFVEQRTLDGIREAQRAFAQPGQLDRLRKYHGDKAEWVLGAWVNTWLSDEFRDWNLDRSLARVRCPLLALHGDRDEYGSSRQPERIVAHAAGPTRLTILPECGHVPHREHERSVLSAVGTFLASLDRSPLSGALTG